MSKIDVFPQRRACCTLRHNRPEGVKSGTASQRGACCTKLRGRRSTCAKKIIAFSTSFSVLYLILCGRRSTCAKNQRFSTSFNVLSLILLGRRSPCAKHHRFPSVLACCISFRGRRNICAKIIVFSTSFGVLYLILRGRRGDAACFQTFLILSQREACSVFLSGRLQRKNCLFCRARCV